MSALAVVLIVEVVVVARVVGVHVATVRGDADTGLAVVGVVGLARRRTERTTELLHAHGADDVAGQARQQTVLELHIAPDHRALHGGRSGAEEPGDGGRAGGHEGPFLAGDHDVARAVGQGLRFAVQVAGEGQGGGGEKGEGHGHGEHGLFHESIP